MINWRRKKQKRLLRGGNIMGKEQEKTLDFASMFTLRKDGRYQGFYLDGNGQWKYVYDRDPERLYAK